MTGSSHQVSVAAVGGDLQVECSCGQIIGEMEGDGRPAVLPLSNINGLAAEHRAEAARDDEEDSPAGPSASS